MLRMALATEKPDALFLFTDPRFFIWVWEMEEEIHQICPIVYWHVWDNEPWPEFNRVLYESTDLINCHSHLTYSMVKERFPEKTNFIPHALPDEFFYPMEQNKIIEIKKQILAPDRADHFVCLWINRNAKRKRSNDVLEAWKLFLDDLQLKHGHQKATLIMHTDPHDSQGPNLLKTSEMLGIQKSVYFSKERLGFDQIGMMHNVSDFCLNISCFPAGTKVVSEYGFKNIEDVSVGESVLTHQGRMRPVIKTFQRKHSGNMHTLHVSNADPISLTGEHPVRAIKQKHANCLPGRNISQMLEQAEWLMAKDVEVGDYVVDCVEKINRDNTTHTLDVWKLADCDELLTRHGHLKFEKDGDRIIYGAVPGKGNFAAYSSLTLDEDLAYIFGEWIADGSTNSTSVSFNKRDADKAELLREMYERKFGSVAKIEEQSKCLSVRLTNAFVYSRFFNNVCGMYSGGKRIPKAILMAADDIKRAFLRGYTAGDGCVLTHKQNGTLMNRVRTVSSGLACDLKQILISLGYCPSIHDDDNSCGYSNNRIWTIEWRDRLHKSGSNGFCRTWSLNNFVIARVFRIDVDDTECDVFNLEVADDNSYACQSFLAHNCNEGFGLGTLEAMQCGRPIIALKTGGLTRQVVDHRDGSENGIALPVETRSLVGSQMVPYIYEDYVSNQTVASAIMKLYEMDPEARAKLGSKARDYVKSEFNLQKVVSDWHETLSTTITRWKNDRATIYSPWEHREL